MGINLYLVRHGNTSWNTSDKFRGKADIFLSELGREQATSQGKRLSKVKFAHVYCSPLKRAQETATKIISLNCTPGLKEKLEIKPELASVDYGMWEGLTPAEVEEKWPGSFDKYAKEPHTVVFPGGESLSQRLDKVLTVLDEALLKYGDKKDSEGNDLNILFVTHQVVTRTFLCHCFKLPDARGYWSIGQETACLNIITIAERDECVVEKMNIGPFDPMKIEETESVTTDSLKTFITKSTLIIMFLSTFLLDFVVYVDSTLWKVF
ncbi:Histidine phosphatase superfamily, clade-1 like protein [Aduncisulcus paluster]|uniref:Histidine phosphatase superfamily, clade-1 like protein n=1 Tax=Aduncisulcus paluster TaxID=2918883 RepID=A0ABQ5K8X9_9EUKA|nr:Histidine phosphatase superfamily, clade-1 like protein [Aduncisulcus paluster]